MKFKSCKKDTQKAKKKNKRWPHSKNMVSQDFLTLSIIKHPPDIHTCKCHSHTYHTRKTMETNNICNFLCICLYSPKAKFNLKRKIKIKKN